jgi:hypothetical protein
VEHITVQQIISSVLALSNVCISIGKLLSFFWFRPVSDQSPEQRESKEIVLCLLGWFLPPWLLGCAAGQPCAWLACRSPVAVTVAALGSWLAA